MGRFSAFFFPGRNPNGGKPQRKEPERKEPLSRKMAEQIKNEVLQDGVNGNETDDEIDLGVIPAGVLVLEHPIVDERSQLEIGNHIFTFISSSLDCIHFHSISL